MITGIVDKAWTKQVPTKNGEASVYLVSLEGESDPFNLKFKNPNLKVGDQVSFNVQDFKYGEHQVDVRSIKVLSRDNAVDERSEAPVPKNTGGGGGSKSGGGYSKGVFPLEPTDGQRSILRQHAFTQASEIVREYYRGGDPDGSMVSEFKNPEEVADRVVSLAYRIEHYTSGDDLKELMGNETK